MNVSVTNKNAESYARKFDGKLYTFPPGEAVVIPVEAAQYLFAYNQGDAERQKIMIRNGWQRNGQPGVGEGTPAWAQKKLGNFIFKKAPDEAPPAKPEKVVTEGVKAAVAAGKARVPGGIAAISPHAKDDGKTILPRAAGMPTGGVNTLHLPGSKVPLAPPA